MNEIINFFAMGGYGAYIWSAYSISMLALLLLWWHARYRERQLLRQLKSAHDAELQQ